MAILCLVLTDHRVLIFQGGAIFKERPLLTWVCQKGFASITEHKPNKLLVHSSIMEQLKKEKFPVSFDEILLLQNTDKNLCRLVVRQGKNLRSFLITMAESKTYPFYYQLKEINEIEPSKDELSEGGII